LIPSGPSISAVRHGGQMIPVCNKTMKFESDPNCANYGVVAEQPVKSGLFFSACAGIRTTSAPYVPPLKYGPVG
jgi:hypothetical protein